MTSPPLVGQDPTLRDLSASGSVFTVLFTMGVRMDDSSANPLVVALLFLARCLVPLALMLGVSYLLRRLGLIAEPPSNDENADGPEAQTGGAGHEPV